MNILWVPKYYKKFIGSRNKIFMSSRRIRCYNLYYKLSKQYQCDILGYSTFKPNIDLYDAVIFQKIIDTKLLLKAKLKKKIVILDLCDPVKKLPNYSFLLDMIHTSSAQLCDNVNLIIRKPINVLYDSHEVDPNKKKLHEQKNKLIFSWYGNPTSFDQSIKPFLKIFEGVDGVLFKFAPIKRDNEPNVISNIEFILPYYDSWKNINTWQKFIYNSDVGIVPTGEGLIKSPHKILNYMAYGIPVICTPSSNNKDIVKHQHNSLFASTPDEWLCAIEKMKNPNYRKQLGDVARNETLDNYNCEKASLKLIELIEQFKNRH